MNELKWTWVLFVTATLVVLIRMGMWFLPAPAARHAQRVEAAADAGRGDAEAAPAEIAEAVPPAAEEAVWPDGPEEVREWPDLDALATRHPGDPLPKRAEVLPEEFHFRRTRWGMSRDEVRAAEEGVPLRESERGLLYATTTLDFPCLLSYAFVQDRLIRVRLSFSDPSAEHIPPLSMAQAQQRFLFLREQLRTRYGESVEQTLPMRRDVSHLVRSVQKQEELTRQYDAEIAEAEERIRRHRALLEVRYERWPNRAELVARGLAPYERDVRDLRAWKQEALDLAAQKRRSIEEHRTADTTSPVLATRSVRWPDARGIHDIELRLDVRPRVPRLDIRYEASRFLGDLQAMDEL